MKFSETIVDPYQPLNTEPNDPVPGTENDHENG